MSLIARFSVFAFTAAAFFFSYTVTGIRTISIADFLLSAVWFLIGSVIWDHLSEPLYYFYLVFHCLLKDTSQVQDCSSTYNENTEDSHIESSSDPEPEPPVTSFRSKLLAARRTGIDTKPKVIKSPQASDFSYNWPEYKPTRPYHEINTSFLSPFREKSSNNESTSTKPKRKRIPYTPFDRNPAPPYYAPRPPISKAALLQRYQYIAKSSTAAKISLTAIPSSQALDTSLSISPEIPHIDSPDLIQPGQLSPTSESSHTSQSTEEIQVQSVTFASDPLEHGLHRAGSYNSHGREKRNVDGRDLSKLMANYTIRDDSEFDYLATYSTYYGFLDAALQNSF